MSQVTIIILHVDIIYLACMPLYWTLGFIVKKNVHLIGVSWSPIKFLYDVFWVLYAVVEKKTPILILDKTDTLNSR